jgi:hypothetical protein
MAKNVPDSRTPRRFSAISTSTRMEATSASCPEKIGIADAAFWTPEEIDTATVST